MGDPVTGIRAVALASGSNGNSLYVETPDVRLLIDAGVSGKRLAERAATRDVDLRTVDALLLTHNHGDHVCGAGVIHRRYGVPVLATRGTWSVVGRRLGRVREVRTFRAGESLRFGKTVVESIPTPHDGVDGVAYVVSGGGRRVGALTDLGHPFRGLASTLAGLDAAFLEANYDPEMLRSGPYPEELKDRIAGPGGHLSNGECVELAREAAVAGRLRWLALSHLSGENNAPDLALRAADDLRERGVQVVLAGRDGASPEALLED